MIRRHISQISLNIPVEQQVHVVNWRIILQPFQIATPVHIPGNLCFHQGIVDGNHSAVSEFGLDTGSVDIELT